jgi:pimeloyl-ACP methyl ester carboxylesterase
MSTVVFVHGRGQLGQGEVALHRSWRSALAASVGSNGGAVGATRFPYYAPILATPGQAALQAATARFGTWMTSLAPRLTARVSAAAKKTHRVAKSVSPIQNESVQKWAVNGDTGGYWSQVFLKALLKDVELYLSDKQIASDVDALVELTIRDALQSGPCVVVGHSLGSVVAFNVLSAMAPHDRIAGFVSLGSPLGWPSVAGRLNREPSGPPACVERWLNAFDERDVVASVGLVGTAYDGGDSRFREDNTLQNGTANRHGIGDCLRSASVGRFIVDALAAGAAVTPS